MTEQMLLDRMSQMIRLGFVNARQPEKMRVKVTLPDTTGSQLITDWLPVLCPRACGDMEFDLPDIGDQVLCLFLAYGLEQGFVIGSMYGRQTPPVQSGDKWHRKFSDGAYLEYDRASHSLTADIPGTASIKASQSISLEAPIIYLRGTLQQTAQDGSPGKSVFSGGMEVMNGGINAMDGDIVASGVSLASHTTEGVQPGSGTSSHPTGGSAESPGTGAIEVAAIGTAAYALTVANRLEVLKHDKNVQCSDINTLIYCLPKIANAMAENDSNGLDKQGWIYLHDFFERWLAFETNRNPSRENIEPMRVNFDWIIAFHRSYAKYFEITQPELLFSKNAQKLLFERLKKFEKFGEEEFKFDYINIPWQQWREKYYQSIGVPSQSLLTPDIGLDGVLADGLQIALAAFMFYALAKGTVAPVKTSKGRYKITIKNVGIVAYDTFNFDGKQSYRFWRCEPPDWSYFDRNGYIELTNQRFEKFQDDTGHGYAFPVISGPKILDIKSEFTYYVDL